MVESVLLIFASIFALTSISLYLYIKNKYNYWRNIGLRGPKPSFLTLGNVLQIEGEDCSKIEPELLRKYGKIYGIYTGLQPTLTVLDAELIKQVLIKDFPVFVNRRALNSFHDLININQFFTENGHWKKIRTITGPTFTTGKLRSMNKMMGKCVDKFEAFLDKVVATKDGVINTKEVISGFTIDVIASTSFATQTNANDDREKMNPFVRNAVKLMEINPLKALCYLSAPKWINDAIGVNHFFNVETFDFYTGLVREIVRQRKQQPKAQTQDLVQLLMDSYADESDLVNDKYEQLTASMDNDGYENNSLSNGKRATLTENEVIAQGVLFFFAGFETTSLTISGCVYELAQNPDAQNQLLSEVNKVLSDLEEDSDLYYEAIRTKIPYLDAVVKETLRKYPAVRRLERRCNTDGYQLGPITLKAGQLVEIPTFGVHHCADYYPNPFQFDPSRFMPENKELLVPYTYLPFGAGPRNCIGMRFAYQEVKILLAKIVPKFQFCPTEETPGKLEFTTFKTTLSPKSFPIKVMKR